jgi:UPF0755 protein
LAVSIAGKLLKILFGLVMVGVVVAVGATIFFFTELGARPSNNTDPVPFSISTGETFTQVAEDLQSAHIIRNVFIFRLRAKMLGAKIESGDFTLTRNLTVDEVLEKLAHARLINRTITIPEGWRAEQIGQLLEKSNIVKQDEFMQLVRTGDFSAKFPFLKDKPPNISIEGFLFPDTYEIPPNYSARDVIEMMLTNFNSKINNQLSQQIQAQGGMWKVMTIAAIVEREARLSSERPTIASVFYNRLDHSMPLQADPTAQYARDSAKYQGSTSYSDWWTALDVAKNELQIDSPYNTYVVQKIPPGPICNPGIASIQAAAKPDQTDYLYFVANTTAGGVTGSHFFAKTYDEQKENIKKNEAGS